MKRATLATASIIVLVAIVGVSATFSAASTLPPLQAAEMSSTPQSTPFPTYGPYSMSSNFYGGAEDDWAYSIKLTSDGGLILAGISNSHESDFSNVWLIKTAPTTYTMGNISGSYQQPQWNVTYGGDQNDGAYCVVQTSDGGYAVAGFTNSSGARAMWLIKMDVSGTEQWNVTFGDGEAAQAKCVIQASNGGYVLAGTKNSSVSQQSAWIVKTDNSGKIQWSKQLSGQSANSVVETSDGAFAFAIEYPNAFGLVKTDFLGNVLLNETFSSPEKVASTQGIVQANDGGFALAGWISNSGTAPSNVTTNRDAWLVKVDSSGKVQWNQTYPQYGVYALIKTMSGGYAMAGDRAILIITDSAGNVLWNQLYDQQDGQYPLLFTRMQSLLEASPNHFVMAGVEDGGPYVHLQFAWIQVALKTGSQLIPPVVTLLSPKDATTYASRNVNLTFTTSEPVKFLVYSVSGLLNFTSEGNTTLLDLPNGKYNVTLYATDAYYNTGTSPTISFAVNSTEPYVLPTVTIQSPTNGTYDQSQVLLTFSTDPTCFWSVYSLDGGQNQTAIPNANMAIVGLSGGTHTLAVYAGDIPNGATGSASVSFTVSFPVIQTPIRVSSLPADANRPPIMPNQTSGLTFATPYPAAVFQSTYSAFSPFLVLFLIVGLAAVASVCIVVIVLLRKLQTT